MLLPLWVGAVVQYVCPSSAGVVQLTLLTALTSWLYTESRFEAERQDLRVGPTLTVQYASEGLLAQASISKPPKHASMALGAEYRIDMFLCLGRPLPPITPTYKVPCSHVGILTRLQLSQRMKRSKPPRDSLDDAFQFLTVLL